MVELNTQEFQRLRSFLTEDDPLEPTQPVNSIPFDKASLPKSPSHGTTTTKSTTQDLTGSIQLNYNQTLTFSQIDLGSTQKESSAEATQSQTQRTQLSHNTPVSNRNGVLDIPSSIVREAEARYKTPYRKDLFDPNLRFASPAKTSPAANDITELPTNSAFSSLSQIFETSSPCRPLPSSAAVTPATNRNHNNQQAFSSPTREQEPMENIPPKDKKGKSRPATTYITIDDSQKARDRRSRFARSTSPTDWNSAPRGRMKKASSFVDSWGNEDDSLGKKIRAQKAKREKEEDLHRLFATITAPARPATLNSKKPPFAPSGKSAKENVARVRDSEIQVARSEDEGFEDTHITTTADTTAGETQICSRSPSPNSAWRDAPTQLISNPSGVSRVTGSLETMEWEATDDGESALPLSNIENDKGADTKRLQTQSSAVLDSQRSSQLRRVRSGVVDDELEPKGSSVIASSPPSLPAAADVTEMEIVRGSSPQTRNPQEDTPCNMRRSLRLESRSDAETTPTRAGRAILTPETSPVMSDANRSSAKRKRAPKDSQENNVVRLKKKNKIDDGEDADVVPCSLEEEKSKVTSSVEVRITESVDAPVAKAAEMRDLERATASPGKLQANRAVHRRQSHHGLQRVAMTETPKLQIPRKTRSGTSLRESALGSAIEPSETSSMDLRTSFNSAPNRVFALFKDSKMHYFPATVIPSAFNADRTSLTVQFDDETTVPVDKVHIRSLDIRTGDQVRVDMPNLKQRIWHIAELKRVDPASSKAKKELDFTDVRGNNVVVVHSKLRNDKEEMRVEVPITKLYIPKSLWHQFFGRPFLNSTPASALSVDSPWSPSLRRSTVGAMHVSITPLGNFSRKSLDAGLFSGMLFAISTGDKDSEKKILVKNIASNGGQVLETGFEELFASPGSTDNNSELLPLPHTSDIGFTCVLSDKHSRRAKFLQALALGVPCLHIRWVKDCLKEKEILPWSAYLLPAGESSYLDNAIHSRMLAYIPAPIASFSEMVAQRPKLLNGKTVLFIGGKTGAAEAKRKPYLFLLYTLSPDKVQCAASLDSVSDEAQSKFDYIYDIATSVKEKSSRKSLRSATSTKVVDDEWVIQSLILGRLLPLP